MELLTKVMRIRHIDITTKWRELGPELIGDYSIISQIEADHKDVNTRCCVLFEKWLERTPDANWDRLITALKEINLKAAADVISKQLKSGSECTVATVNSCIPMLLSVNEPYL